VRSFPVEYASGIVCLNSGQRRAGRRRTRTGSCHRQFELWRCAGRWRSSDSSRTSTGWRRLCPAPRPNRLQRDQSERNEFSARQYYLQHIVIFFVDELTWFRSNFLSWDLFWTSFVSSDCAQSPKIFKKRENIKSGSVIKTKQEKRAITLM